MRLRRGRRGGGPAADGRSAGGGPEPGTAPSADQHALAWAGLGNDPNLYGHAVKPGLFAFKVRLGFEAVPSTTVDPDDGQDEADLIVGLSRLGDPSFVLSYADPREPAALQLDAFTRAGDPAPRPPEAPFLRRSPYAASTRRRNLLCSAGPQTRDP